MQVIYDKSSGAGLLSNLIGNYVGSLASEAGKQTIDNFNWRDGQKQMQMGIGNANKSDMSKFTELVANGNNIMKNTDVAAANKAFEASGISEQLANMGFRGVNSGNWNTAVPLMQQGFTDWSNSNEQFLNQNPNNQLANGTFMQVPKKPNMYLGGI